MHSTFWRERKEKETISTHDTFYCLIRASHLHETVSFLIMTFQLVFHNKNHSHAFFSRPNRNFFFLLIFLMTSKTNLNEVQ